MAKIEKINFHYPKGVLQSVFEGEALTALELAALTAKKVDEAVDIVNMVEQTAIEATVIVDEMRADQQQFITENTDVKNQILEDNRVFIEGLTEDKELFSENMKESLNEFKGEITTEKTVFVDTMMDAVSNIIKDSNDTIKLDVYEKVDGLVLDGTIEGLINDNILLDVKRDIKDNEISGFESTGYGVLTGLEVLPQSSANMSVLISKGVAHLFNGKRFELFENKTINISTANPTHPRIDIIYISADGVLSYGVGVPSPTPVAPSPLDVLILGEILINTNTSSISKNTITDVRKFKRSIAGVNDLVDDLTKDILKINEGITDLIDGGVQKIVKTEIIPLENDKKGRSINVMYPPAPLIGAKGDYNKTTLTGTDDQPTIQAIIDYLDSVGGGELFFPVGNFFFGNTITIKRGVTLTGSGHSNWDYRLERGTWLVMKKTLETLIQVGSETSGFVNGSGVNNVSLTVQGFENGGVVNGVGLWERNAYYFHSNNIYIEGFNEGVKIGDASIAKTLSHTYSNTNISECNTFIRVTSGADVTFNGGRIGTNGANTIRRFCHIQIDGNCDSLTFNRLILAHNGWVDYNVRVGVAPTVSLFWITFNDCDMETATVNAVLIDASATFIRINNSWVGSPAPFVFAKGGRIKVEKCTFANHAGKPSAVHITGSTSDVDITHNDFISTPNTHVLIDTLGNNVNVLNNLVDGGGSAVKIAPKSGTPKNFMIKDNKIKNIVDNAIDISTTYCSQIKIVDNTIEDYTNHGLMIDGGSGDVSLMIVGNTIRTTKASGVRRALFITSPISGVIVSNNDMRGNTSGNEDASVEPKIVNNNLTI